MAKANRPYRNHTVFVVVLFFQFRRSDGSNILVGPWCASVCVCLCWWRCVCFIFHAYKFFWLDSRLLLLELLPLPLLGDCYWKVNDRPQWLCAYTNTYNPYNMHFDSKILRVYCVIFNYCMCCVGFFNTSICRLWLLQATSPFATLLSLSPSLVVFDEICSFVSILFVHRW